MSSQHGNTFPAVVTINGKTGRPALPFDETSVAENIVRAQAEVRRACASLCAVESYLESELRDAQYSEELELKLLDLRRALGCAERILEISVMVAPERETQHVETEMEASEPKAPVSSVQTKSSNREQGVRRVG